MSTLATCDPGIDAGTAAFNGGTLVWCGLNQAPSKSFNPYYLPFDRLVIEIPNANEKRKRGNPQNLIKLAVTAGRWIERIHHVSLAMKLPFEWKGNTDKELHNGLVLQALTPLERTTFAYFCKGIAPGKLNNVVDAIGLGLEDLGRITRGGRLIG